MLYRVVLSAFSLILFFNIGLQSAYGEDGRIFAHGKDFSIIPPEGWLVYDDKPGLTLFMEAPDQEKSVYKRHLQVRYGQGSYNIDEYTPELFAEKLSFSRKKVLPSSANYSLSSHSLITMANGSPGLILYYQFNLDDLALMDMHLLISSADGHFLLTYTDLAEVFQDSSRGSSFSQAYEAMISSQLVTQSRGRFDMLILIVGVLAGFAIIFLVFRLRQGRHNYGVSSGLDDDFDELDTNEATSDAQSSISSLSHREGREFASDAVSMGQSSFEEGTTLEPSSLTKRVSGHFGESSQQEDTWAEDDLNDAG